MVHEDGIIKRKWSGDVRKMDSGDGKQWKETAEAESGMHSHVAGMDSE